MKIQLEIKLSKETIKQIFEEMYRSAMSQSASRSMAARKGWETRRKNTKLPKRKR